MILDASVLLSAFFPDEAQGQAQTVLQEHEAGRERLKAPELLTYEVANAVLQAERRGRISSEQANAVLNAAAGLGIELFPMEWGASLPLARQFGRSAYDATYLTLAERLDEQLVTGDLRLYNAVRSALGRVLWIGDYKPTE
jgi:predicted nucleic acid-binding protein